MVGENKRSYVALQIVIIVMFVLLAGQLYRVQILDGSNLKAMAQDNREREITTKAIRGIIYDRNGQRLVVNNPSYAIAVTPADLPDINCAVQDLEGSETFSQLATILQSNGGLPVNDIITLQPKLLTPTEKVGEVANRLSVLLQVDADLLRVPLNSIMEKYPESERLFEVRSDVPAATGDAIRAALADLPGIQVYNQLEYNFITRFDNCLKPITVMSGVNYDTMQKVETARASLPGVSVQPEPVRAYTDGPLFSHLLGYIGPISPEEYEASKAEGKGTYEPDDKVGRTGLELTLEEMLRGSKGSAQLKVNSKERVVDELSARPPVTGNNVALTIDADLQRKVTAALQNGLNLAKVKAGVAIVMRVDNGQILSLVSLPSYDNNWFANGIKQDKFDLLNNDPTMPMFHRAVSGAYPPGSTYKMVTAAAALQEGVVTPSTTYYCPGTIEVPFTANENQRNPYRDWRAAGHGTINIVEALTVSSDVFFYIVAGPRQEERRIRRPGGDEITWTRYYTPGGRKPIEFNGLGIERLHRYSTGFGFGQKTGVELPGESAGLAPTQDWKVTQFPDNPWSLGDTLVTAIGQGFNLQTPLQLANATAAVANGGTLYQPQLVGRVTDWAGNPVQEFQPKVLGQLPVSAENLGIVREGMRQVIADKKGTAHYQMTLKSIQVAGKTGTAEYGEPIRVEKGKEIRRSHAWFSAFAPFDKPEIAVVVLLEGGEESLEGSTFAVPVTDAILKAYFKVEE